MAKKTRTELSTLALNTNLPDNTTELITPTTERAQLTDERESVVNYKDDLGGVPNAGKFLTVAVDGESLTMVDAPTGDVTGSGVQYQVAVWDGTNSLTGNAAFQFLTGAQNSIKLIRGTGSGNILFYAADGTTLHGYIENQVSGNGLTIGQRDGVTSAVIDLDDSTITFKTNNNPHLTITSGGNVGIGTDNPNALLQINRNTSTANVLNLIDVCASIGNNNSNPGNHYSSGIRVYQGSGTMGTGLAVMNIGVSTNSAAIGNKNTGLIETPNGMSGGLNFKCVDSDAIIKFQTDNTERMRITSGGVINSYYGIKFGTGATLDAYEEGTWTPIMNQGGANVTADVANGIYTRVGNLLHISFYFYSTTPNNLSGSWQVKGLPYYLKFSIQSGYQNIQFGYNSINGVAYSITESGRGQVNVTNALQVYTSWNSTSYTSGGLELSGSGTLLIA